MEWKAPWFLTERGIDAYIEGDDYVVLDFETTNRTHGLAIDKSNHLVLACWTTVRKGVSTNKYVFGDEYAMRSLLVDVRAAKFVVAHNAKFELQWLARCGLDLRDVLVFDTMVMEWVINGNKKVPYNLEDTGRRYGLGGKESLVSNLIKYGECPSVIPQSWLLKYCIKDVELCHKLYLKQREKLTNLDLWHIALSRNVTVPVLADIEMQGLQLDKEMVYAEELRLQQLADEAGARLDEITGGINVGSPKQLAKFLFDTLGFAPPVDQRGEVIKTATGGISTAAASLRSLKASTPEQEQFLKQYEIYNNAVTLLSKNISFFKQVCDHFDGVFYGSLNHCRTSTHRLASSGIEMLIPGQKKASKAQIQNLPRQYKKLFTAHDPDYVVLEADGAQLEFRVAADIGHDKQAESDIINGVDIHSFTAQVLVDAGDPFFLSLDPKDRRQNAKSRTFAPLYGGNGQTPAEQEYAKAFRKKYNGIASTQANWTLTVADRKQLVTPYGLIFYWPDAKIHKSGYVSYTTEIYNMPIQGFATAEIIPIALVHFWHRVRGMRVQIFNTIHDSIVSRVHKDDVEEVMKLSKIALTQDVYRFLREVYNYQFKVPLGVGMKVAKNWGTSKDEHVWDVWPNGEERYKVKD